MRNAPAYVYPHIQVPFFIMNSFYDSWQLGCIVTAQTSTGNCNSYANWTSCLSSPIDCSADQVT